ncbi:MAG: hypothetical protein MUF48_23935, partial [Pirellulaceae bacterium]|nr:hypothetical protein [Pirellulaceae bacterium]
MHASLAGTLLALRLGVPDPVLFDAQGEALLFLLPACTAIVGTAWSAWCLVGFPAALAARASRRADVLILVPGVLWLLTAAAVPGTAAFPLLPLLLVSAVQGF